MACTNSIKNLLNEGILDIMEKSGSKKFLLFHQFLSSQKIKTVLSVENFVYTVVLQFS